MPQDFTGPIGEDDLHAFVDGRLDAVRLAAVRAYLGEHPAQMARVRAFEAQRAALSAALAFKAAEPVPARLRLRSIRSARRRTGLARARAAAVVAGLFLAGAGLGWMTRGALHGEEQAAVKPAPAVQAPLARAADAQRAAPGTTKPAETLLGWMRDGAGEPMPMPDLVAFGLILEAAQPLAGEDGGAALLRYADAAGALVFVMRQQARDTLPHALRCADGPGGLVTYTWSDGRHLHAVTAALPRDTLRPVAHAVERAIRDAPPPPGGLMAGIARRPCPTGLG